MGVGSYSQRRYSTHRATGGILSDIEGIAGAALCAQDVSAHEAGAHTGEISAQMLREFNCSHALVGHSERRLAWDESNAVVAEKARRLEAVGFAPSSALANPKM